MEITFLGTASAYPTPNRGVSAIIYRNDGLCWMFDCGEGTQIQLMKSAIRLGKISKIFITHLHGDHLFGLPGLLCTISQTAGRAPEDKERSLVELYGPSGLRRFIRTSLELSRSQLGFDYVVHELVPLAGQEPEELQGWTVDHAASNNLHPNEREGRAIQADTLGAWHVLEDDRHHVRAGALIHRVPCFGYVIEEKPYPGKLDVSLLKARGLSPGPVCARLKDGQSVQAPDGTMVSPSDVVGAPKPGRKVVILGDTSDSRQMESLCHGADLLIHEATLSNDLQDNAIAKGHSTPGMAGRFARQVAAKRLVLTHFSQRYKSQAQKLKEGDECVDVLVTQAKREFGDDVIAAEDLATVVVEPTR